MFADLYRRRELVWILVQRNLKIRYKHSALGFLWSLLTPLLMILMYAVFASILKFNTGSPDYLPSSSSASSCGSSPPGASTIPSPPSRAARTS